MKNTKLTWAGAGFLIAMMVMAVAPTAKAATTWTKAVTSAGATDNWSTGTNWSAVPISAADTTLVFGYSWTTNSTAATNTLTNNVANPFSLNVLTLGINITPNPANGSSIALINIAGSPLNFVTNGGTTPQVNLSQNRSGGQVVSFDVQSGVVLTDNILFTGNGTANFTVSGAISGAGVITKGGTSALTLSGANSGTGGLVMNAGSLTISNASNSYIGGTSINAGTLSISSTGTLGSNVNTNNVSLAAGASLNLSGAGNTGANQTITLTSTAGSLSTLALGYNGVPAATIAQADTNGGVIALNNVTGFTGNLTTALTGKNLFLGGLGTSTFTGAVGTVVAGNDTTYRLGGGGGSISFNTANLITGANSVQIGSTATGGTGTVIFGAAQNYSAGTNITAGSTLRFDTLTSMPATGTVTVADGAILGVTVNTGIWGGGTGVAGIAGLTSTANGGEGYGGQAGALVNFDGNSRLLLNVTGNVSEANTITNGSATSIALIKSGASNLTLSGNNSYSGGTTLSQGVLAVGHNSALGGGTLTINGGTTIQSDSSTARTLSNALTIGGDFTVGGSGDLTFSNTGASALGATRQITVNTGRNATFAQAFSGSGVGITKAGAGTLTLTGANNYTGTTTLNAGAIVLNNGSVTGSTVSFTSNTSLSILGGSGVSSTWNAGSGDFGALANNYNNIQMLIDGKGTAGTAVLTVNNLLWGRTASNSTITLTDGGRMNVNGEVRIGNPYYNTNGNSNITIGGGTAISTFTGNTGQAFYIGYGERENSNNNVVTVNSGGVLTSVGNMFVGNVNNQQGNDLASTANKLTVTGTGTASMVSITVGYAQTAGIVGAFEKANANVVEVINGGQLTTSGVSYIGRAIANYNESNANTLTVGGTGSSSWNAGNQNVFVGFTNASTSTSSNDNILTVGAGGTVTGINGLTIGSGAGTKTGNQLVVNGGSLTATTVTVNAINSLQIGVNGGSLIGNIVNNGALNISSTVPVSLAGNISGSGATTQTGSGVTTLSGTNIYSGGTTINAGMVQFTKLTAMPASNAVAVNDSATLGVNVGGVGEWTTGTSGNGTFGGLLTGLGGQTGGTVTYTGNVTLSFDTTNAGSDQTYSGVIANVGTTLGITKLGVGTLVFDQANTYTGTTTVSAGTLAGTGSVTSSVTVKSGGTLAPGIPSGATGTFTAKNADFSNGGTLKIRLVDLTHFDVLALTDTSSMTSLKMGGSSVLQIDLSGLAVTDTEFVIATATTWSTGPGNGFATVQFLPSNTANARVSYKGTSGTGVEVRVALGMQGVTPVKIANFAAKSEGAGVKVSWTAVSEYQNAGFNIYRRNSDGGEWTLVNPAIIAGRVTNPDERKYTYFDWASAGEWQYKLESIDISGGKETYVQFAGPVSVDWNNDLSVVSEVDSGSVSAVNDGFEIMAGVRNAQVVSATIAAMKQDAVELNKVTVREVTAMATGANSISNIAARSVASSAPSNSSSPSMSNVGVRWFSSGRVSASSFAVAKLVYSKPGVMIIPQNSMPNGYDLNNVSLQREGRNMSALAKVPAGLLVYAPGYADDYTDKDAVFIRKSSAATNVVSALTSTGLFSSSSPVNVASPATVTNDYHDVYFDYSSVYRPFSFAPWFSSKYLTQGATQDFVINLPQASSGPAKLTLNLWSLTSDAANPDHALQLVVNGQIIGDTSWDGGNKMMQLSFDVPTGVMLAGENTVSLVTPTLAGVASQVCFMHSISADYTRLLDGSQSFEIVNNTGKAQLYELNNVPASGAWIVDTRFTDRASLVASETMVQADGTLRLRFMAASGGTGKFVVTPVGKENAPISITSRLVKAAKLTGTYLATGPLQFSSGVQPLLMKRSKEGIRGTYFDQEQLFDYYNFGRYGPDGIRNAVRSLKPTYLLLVGRTTYDYRNYEGKNVDPLCPAYLVSTSFWAQTTSDSLFGDLGRGYPEVAVGRLPVNNTTELSSAINHIVNYKGIPQSGLRLHAVADQPDPLTADFGAQLDTMVKAYNPDVTWQENYLQRTYQSSPEVTDALKTAANGGADLILYSGHGNAARLGNNAPNILDQTTVQQWTGNTVFLQSTCTANWMAKNVHDYKSIAIQALTQAQGGISASVGTSTYMNPDVATAFMNQLIKNTNQSNARWGNVLLSTQQWAGRQTNNGFYTDLMNTEQLFGDPAMPVFAPKSINTAPSSNSGAGTPVGTF